jgi:hypothetical protein
MRNGNRPRHRRVKARTFLVPRRPECSEPRVVTGPRGRAHARRRTWPRRPPPEALLSEARAWPPSAPSSPASRPFSFRAVDSAARPARSPIPHDSYRDDGYRQDDDRADADRQDEAIDATVARVSYTSGDISFSRGGRPRRVAGPRRQRPDGDRDRVYTGDRGRLELQITGGNAVRLDARSDLTALNLSQGHEAALARRRHRLFPDTRDRRHGELRGGTRPRRGDLRARGRVPDRRRR